MLRLLVSYMVAVALLASQTQAATPETPPQSVAAMSALDQAADNQMQHDAVLIAKLAASGWQALPVEAFKTENGGLVTPDGQVALEAAGQQADLLLEFGCTDIVSRRFKRGQRYCTLAMFHFRSTAGAYGAYTNLRIGASTFLVRGDASSEADDSISFWKGFYFVALSTSTHDDDEAKEMLTSLANAVASELEDAKEKPLLLRQLPVLERLSGSERLFMGPLAVKLHVALPYIDELQLTRCRSAISADYQYPPPYSERLRLLVVEYGNSNLAANVYNAYSASLTQAHKPIENTEHSLLCKVNNSFLMCKVAGTQMQIIAGARKRYAPAMLSGQLGRLKSSTTSASAAE